MALSRISTKQETRQIAISGGNTAEIDAKAQCLETIARLSLGTLRILADKAQIPGIESKIEAYKNFI